MYGDFDARKLVNVKKPLKHTPMFCTVINKQMEIALYQLVDLNIFLNCTESGSNNYIFSLDVSVSTLNHTVECLLTISKDWIGSSG